MCHEYTFNGSLIVHTLRSSTALFLVIKQKCSFYRELGPCMPSKSHWFKETGVCVCVRNCLICHSSSVIPYNQLANKINESFQFKGLSFEM